MAKRNRFIEVMGAIIMALSLSGCPTGGSGDNAALNINFTNPANASQIATPDIVVSIAGTVESATEIQAVKWNNDRGGSGIASGKENWATGNIVLMLGTNNITITATDVDGLSSTKGLAVERENNSPGSGSGSGSTAPTISGRPSGGAAVGVNYKFAPTVNDADGDSLTFSITKKPAWATFNTSTGVLRGTPSTSHVGTYNGIVISVSDGKTSVGLPAFSIKVEAAALGSATLSWVAPTERVDNTPLTDLAGFEVHYGQASGNYSNQIKINNPGISTYVVENLPPGTWYFAVTAHDSAGQSSDFSNQGNTTIAQ